MTALFKNISPCISLGILTLTYKNPKNQSGTFNAATTILRYTDSMQPGLPGALDGHMPGMDTQKVNHSTVKSSIGLKQKHPINTSVALYNLSGNLIKNISHGFLKAGNYSEKIGTKRLPNGSYILALTSRDSRVTKTLQKIMGCSPNYSDRESKGCVAEKIARIV
jgi:hypothetical protein